MSRESTNVEGLTFEEWVCAAGLAVFDQGWVRPYTESSTYWQPYTKGSIGTSSERFFDMVPRYRRVRARRCFYAQKIRTAWKNGEDPTEWRANKEG